MKNTKKFTAVLSALAVLMTLLASCGTNNTADTQVHNEGFYNETYNKAAVLDGDTYYISGNTLYCGIDVPTAVAENVSSVQSYDGKLYYTTVADGDVTITEYDGANSIDTYFANIGDGVLRKIAVCGDDVYAIIDNKLYEMRSGEAVPTELKERVTDFAICGGYLYYVEGEANTVGSNGAFVEDISDMGMTARIVKRSTETGREEVIAENNSYYTIAPLNGGIAYYDSDSRELMLYKGDNSETLTDGWITGIISYDNYVVYASLNENAVYRLDVNGGEPQKISDYKLYLYGISPNAIYAGANADSANEPIWYTFENVQ